MAIIKKRTPFTKPIPCNLEELNIPDEWWKEFALLLDGSAWNTCCNAWVNEQYSLGKTPKEVYSQCKRVYL